MINFKQIIECMVEHTPAGRRNGIDCVETSRRGLLAIDMSGDLYRYNYSTKEWARQVAMVEYPTPSLLSSSTPAIEASEI